MQLQRGAEKWQDQHFPDPGIVAFSGSPDMPAKRWKTVFVNSCDSGGHFYDTFNHGVLFFTYGTCVRPETTREFFKAVIEGKSNDEILSALNSVETVNDYWVFGGP